jgi:hypothetical protein
MSVKQKRVLHAAPPSDRPEMTATAPKLRNHKDPLYGQRTRIFRTSSEAAAGTVCSECGVIVRLLTGHFDDWFAGKTARCDACGKAFDLYAVTLEWLSPHELLKLAGARVTEYVMPVSEGLTQLSFDRLKIPQDAKILDRHFEGMRDPDKLFERLRKRSELSVSERRKLSARPLKLLDDMPTRQSSTSDDWGKHKKLSREISIFARKSTSEDAAETVAKLVVIWATDTEKERCWRYIRDACVALTHGDLNETIVSGNVAIETALNSFLHRLLGENASNAMMKKIQRVHLSTKFDTVMKLLSAATGWVEVPQKIDEHLNTLREYRNDVAHDGEIKTPPTKKQLEKIMLSVIFAAHFLRKPRRRK